MNVKSQQKTYYGRLCKRVCIYPFVRPFDPRLLITHSFRWFIVFLLFWLLITVVWAILCQTLFAFMLCCVCALFSLFCFFNFLVIWIVLCHTQWQDIPHKRIKMNNLNRVKLCFCAFYLRSSKFACVCGVCLCMIFFIILSFILIWTYVCERMRNKRTTIRTK